MLMGACEAVTRDLRHAACVETLTIRFLPLSSFSFCSMRRLAEALDAVPNLKRSASRPGHTTPNNWPGYCVVLYLSEGIRSS